MAIHLSILGTGITVMAPGEQRAPIAFIDEQAALEASHARAAQELVTELRRRLGALHGS